MRISARRRPTSAPQGAPADPDLVAVLASLDSVGLATLQVCSGVSLATIYRVRGGKGGRKLAQIREGLRAMTRVAEEAAP